MVTQANLAQLPCGCIHLRVLSPSASTVTSLFLTERGGAAWLFLFVSSPAALGQTHGSCALNSYPVVVLLHAHRFFPQWPPLSAGVRVGVWVRVGVGVHVGVGERSHTHAGSWREGRGSQREDKRFEKEEEKKYAGNVKERTLHSYTHGGGTPWLLLFIVVLMAAWHAWKKRKQEWRGW